MSRRPEDRLAHLSALCALITVAAWATALSLRATVPIEWPLVLFGVTAVFSIPATAFAPRRWSDYKWRKRS